MWSKISLLSHYLLYELQLYNILVLIHPEGHINVIDFTKNPRDKNIMKKCGTFENNTNTDDLDNPRVSAKISIADRALSFFKGSPVEPQFIAWEPINNRNILLYSQKDESLLKALNINKEDFGINR